MIASTARLVRISKISSTFVNQTHRVIKKKISQFKPKFIKPITLDNGAEHAEYKEIAKI